MSYSQTKPLTETGEVQKRRPKNCYYIREKQSCEGGFKEAGNLGLIKKGEGLLLSYTIEFPLPTVITLAFIGCF